MGLAGATHSRVTLVDSEVSLVDNSTITLVDSEVALADNSTVTLVDSEVALADASVAALWKNTKGRWGSGDDDIDEIRIDASTNVLSVIDYAHHEVHSGSHYYIQGFTTLGNNLGVDDTLRVKLVTPNTDKWIHLLYDIRSTKAMTTTFDEVATGGMTGGLRVTIHANNRAKCYTGIHTGANDQATVLTDSTANYTPDALIGRTIYNTTDGSSAIIIDNDVTTITVAALVGGTGNEWDTGDKYEVNDSKIILTSGVTAATTYDQRIESNSWGADEKKLTIGGGGSRGDELVLRPNTTYLRTMISTAETNLISFRASWYEHSDRH